MKNRKLFASFAIAAGMVVSAIISQGNIVEAATAPTMLGAEILKDETGSSDQALRIGMTVSYQGATDFGMYLVKKSVLGSAEPTVATANKLAGENKAVKVSYAAGQTEIIDINTESKTLTYGVELTGVTKDYYETEVVAIGYVEDVEGNKDTNITRNVMDVAVASGQFVVNENGALVYGNTDVVVDLSKMSMVAKKSSVIPETYTVDKKDENGNVVKDENGNTVKESRDYAKAGSTIEPEISYNSETNCWDIKNVASDGFGDQGQSVTFDLGKTYDLNDYEKIVVQYKGDGGNKSAEVELTGETGSVKYFKEHNVGGINWEVDGGMTWYAIPWANGNRITLDISQGVPYSDGDGNFETQAYKKDMSISKLKLSWPMAWRRNDNNGEVEPYNWEIESIVFVRNDVKAIERTVDLSKVVLSTGSQNNWYDAEKGALAYQNLSGQVATEGGNKGQYEYNWYHQYANLKDALTSTFDSQYYSEVRFNIQAFDTKGTRDDNKVRLRLVLPEDDKTDIFDGNNDRHFEIKADNDIYTFGLGGKSNGGNGGLRFSLSGAPYYAPTNPDDIIYVSEITFVQ